MSPLYIAMSKGTEILDWLITDYNINLCDNQGNTPLHIAAIFVYAKTHTTAYFLAFLYFTTGIFQGTNLKNFRPLR